MSRAKVNKIWFVDRGKLSKLVTEANTLADILRVLTISCSSANYTALKRRLDSEGIEYKHIALGKDTNKGRKFPNNGRALSLSNVMVKNSSYSRSCLKRRLLSLKLLKNECSECGLKDTWNDKPISMQIDHINGIPDDHRLENLRMICANCHSQTETFSGKNIRVSSIDKMGRSERLEGGLIPSSRTDWRKQPRLKARKVVHPSYDELKSLLWLMPTTQIAKQFGVSDKAIDKWAKVYGINKPPRGYWSKNRV